MNVCAFAAQANEAWQALISCQSTAKPLALVSRTGMSMASVLQYYASAGGD